MGHATDAEHRQLLQLIVILTLFQQLDTDEDAAYAHCKGVRAGMVMLKGTLSEGVV